MFTQAVIIKEYNLLCKNGLKTGLLIIYYGSLKPKIVITLLFAYFSRLLF